MKSRKYINKIYNTNGFTLAELLVTVSIIGVLVAVSIPIFASQLSKSKLAVDQANVRSAKAAALVEYMSSNISEEITYYYNAASGTVQKNIDGISGYGKTTDEKLKVQTGATGDPVSDDGTAAFVAVTIPDELSSGIELAWTTSNIDTPVFGGDTMVTNIINYLLTYGDEDSIKGKPNTERKKNLEEKGSQRLRDLLANTYHVKDLPSKGKACDFLVFTDSPKYESFEDNAIAITFKDSHGAQYIFYKNAIYTTSILASDLEKQIAFDKNNNNNATYTSSIIEKLITNLNGTVLKSS